MTQYHGKLLYLAVRDAGDVERNISAHVVSVDMPRTVDTADVSTAGDHDHDFLPGLRGATLTMNYIWDDTVDTGPDDIMEGLLGIGGYGPLLAGGWVFGPAGNAPGKVKYSGAGHVTAFNVTSSVSDAVKATGSIQITGPVTRALFT